MFISAVIVGAGKGERLKGAVAKQFLELNGKPVLAHAIEKFQNCAEVNEIILVTKGDYVDFCQKKIVDKYGFSKVSAVVCGGSRRQDSVVAGLSRCAGETDIVLIHDGVRPFVSVSDIQNVIDGVVAHTCCTLGVPVKDTVKVCDGQSMIVETLDRSKLWNMQTPQGFPYKLLKAAYEDADKHGFSATDDCLIAERLGHKVHVVCGSYFNIKITTQEDLVFANAIVQESEKEHQHERS